MFFEVGTRIRSMRKARGMTQATLAKKLGVAYQNVGQWESGKRVPTLETLSRIADALDVSVFDFLPGSDFDKALARVESQKEKSEEKIATSDPELAKIAAAYLSLPPEKRAMVDKMFDWLRSGFSAVCDDAQNMKKPGNEKE